MGVEIVFASTMPGGGRGVGGQLRKMCGVTQQRDQCAGAQHYRQRGEQTAVVCVLTHYLQPYMLVGIQEVIIICVPGEGRGTKQCDNEERERERDKEAE